jgi:hypothetical protein
MHEAQIAGDVKAYFDARSIVEAKEREGWTDSDYSEQISSSVAKSDANAKLEKRLDNMTAWERAKAEAPTSKSAAAQNGEVLDMVRAIDPDDPDDKGILFHRRRDDVPPEYPYYIRIQANRELNDKDVEKLAGMLGYTYRSTVAGESLGWPVRDTPYSFYVHADTTKSSRDDAGMALEELEEKYPTMLHEGTPVRKRAYNGQPAGTRAIDPVDDPNLKVHFYYDSVYEEGMKYGDE